MTGLRLGVVADPHVSLERDEPASWHNPYRLADAHERLVEALAHPLIAGADVIAVLGDLAHFGDRASIRFVVDAVRAAAAGRPAVVLSGNHDVLADGVRLEDEVAAAAAGDVVVCPCPLRGAVGNAGVGLTERVRGAGFGLELHEVWALSERGAQPFDVVAMRLAEVAGPLLVLSHFPVLSVEARCREASMFYSGHLAQLSPLAVPVAPAGQPMVVLSGHLHLRAATTEAATLQLCFAALVEAPYEVASVELSCGSDDAAVSYECASVLAPAGARLPVLDPPSGRWVWASSTGEWAPAISL